jgi:osmotically-inducible protein OsmY
MKMAFVRTTPATGDVHGTAVAYNKRHHVGSQEDKETIQNRWRDAASDSAATKEDGGVIGSRSRRLVVANGSALARRERRELEGSHLPSCKFDLNVAPCLFDSTSNGILSSAQSLAFQDES